MTNGSTGAAGPDRQPAPPAGPPTDPTQVEVLAAVFTVHTDAGGIDHLDVLLWQRAQDPDAGRWALPGGTVLPDEDVDSSAARQLAAKVDLTQVAHLEQIGVFSDPERVPGGRVMATGFLGLVPLGAEPDLPADTHWQCVDRLPLMAMDHQQITDRARQRLQAKLSYTNIGFALAPAEFSLAELRRIYACVLGHDVDPTNLHRILRRRGMLEATGSTAAPGPAGGRPAAHHRFTVAELRITDPFAAFRPKGR